MERSGIWSHVVNTLEDIDLSSVRPVRSHFPDCWPSSERVSGGEHRNIGVRFVHLPATCWHVANIESKWHKFNVFHTLDIEERKHLHSDVSCIRIFGLHPHRPATSLASLDDGIGVGAEDESVFCGVR